MNAIFKRRSIRKYLDIPVSEEQLERLLRAGMASPTSDNDQEWVFVVIKSAETMEKIINMDSYAWALKTAPLCIAVCADMQKVSEPKEVFWIQDLSASAENMLVEAADMDLGSLWIGLYPAQRNILRNMLYLPAHIEPLMILAFGTAEKKKEPINRYYKDRVYFERYK